MSVAEMRKAILIPYPGDKWKNKVAAMSDGQVLAIFQRFISKGLIKI